MIRYADHIAGYQAKAQACRSARVDVSVWGHSVVEGAYSNDSASSVDATWRVAGWVPLLRDSLAASFGVTPGEGWIWPGGFSLSTRYSLSGAVAETGLYGIAGNRVKFTADTDTATIQLPICSGFRLHMLGGFGDLRYTIDGGSTFTVATSTAATYLHEVTHLEESTHTLVVKGPTSGSGYLLGVEARRSPDRGVAVHRFGLSGMCLADFVAWGAGSVGFQNSATSGDKDKNLASVTTGIGADLVVMMFDANDVTRGWSTYGLLPEDIYDNVTTLLTKLDALGVEALLVTGPQRDPTTYGTGFLQTDAAAAYAAAAADSTNAAWLNLLEYAPEFATFTAADAAGYMFDSVHPNSTGHAAIADAVAYALTFGVETDCTARTESLTIGDRVRMRLVVTDPDGVRVDPGAVALTVTDPHGVPTDVLPGNAGPGLWDYYLTPDPDDGAGTYRATWTGTGPAALSEEQTVRVPETDTELAGVTFPAGLASFPSVT